MKTGLFLTLIFILTTGTALPDVVIRDGIIATSLVRVVASPEKYSGKRILIKGYYEAGFEHSEIYLSRDDARIFNTQQGLWIGGPKEGHEVKYPRKGFITVVGTLKYEAGRGEGHMGLCLGKIVDVELIKIHK